MTPKEYFEQVFDLDKEVESKQLERDAIRATVLGATAWEDNPSFSNQFHSTTENMVLKLDDYSNDINQLIDELVDLKMQLGTEIDQLEDRRYRIVLRERYIRCKEWADISIQQNYVKRYLYELHNDALVAFAKEFPDKFN